MKILVVTPHYYPETFSITSIAEDFVKSGHEVFVVTDQPNYGFGRILEGYEKRFDETINGVRVHRVKTKPRKNGSASIIQNYLSYWYYSKKYLKKLKEEFDVVYSMSLSPVIAVSGANYYAKKHHLKHVLHCLDLWPESPVITGAIKRYGFSYVLLYWWSKSIYKKVDEILISSKSFESYFRNNLRLKKAKISYVPQPPLLPNKIVEPKVYQKPFNFVYAGNIGTIQLVENLVRSFVFLDDSYHLHVLGMGSRKAKVTRLIKELYLDNRVTFYGPKPQAEAASFFPFSTALIVSLKEGGVVGKTVPAKLISSLSYGKPIFACISGDGKEVLDASGGAVFSKDETPESMAEAFKVFASLSEKELSDMGKKNLEYYKNNFDFDMILGQIKSHLTSK